MVGALGAFFTPPPPHFVRHLKSVLRWGIIR